MSIHRQDYVRRYTRMHQAVHNVISAPRDVRRKSVRPTVYNVMLEIGTQRNVGSEERRLYTTLWRESVHNVLLEIGTQRNVGSEERRLYTTLWQKSVHNVMSGIGITQVMSGIGAQRNIGNLCTT